MFIFERQSQSGGGAEREGDTESEAGSRLWAVSMEPDAGLEPTDREIMTWAEVERSTDSATQAPLFVTALFHLAYCLQCSSVSECVSEFPSFSRHVVFQFSQHRLLKRLSFPTVYSFVLCQRLIDHIVVGSFLDFLSCSLDIGLFLCQYHTVLITTAFYYNCKSRFLMPPAFLFQDFFGYSGSFVGQDKFGKTTNTWRLNNILLKNEWVNQEIRN